MPTEHAEISPVQSGQPVVKPDFRVVLLDETKEWTDAALVERAGRIWGAHLYDANRSVHAVEITPSYELYHLYSTAENEIPDDMREMLLMYGSPETDVTYMHCHTVDAIPWTRKFLCSGNEADFDRYEDQVEDMREYLQGNVKLDVPVPISADEAKRIVTSLAERGALDEIPAVVAGMERTPAYAVLKAAVKAAIGHGQSSSMQIAVLEVIGAIKSYEQAGFPENPNEGERLALARRFYDEVTSSCDNVGSIAHSHGVETLADLFYFQGAILNGSEIKIFPASKVVEVVKHLASASEWLSHAVFYNRHAEREMQASAIQPASSNDVVGPSI